MSNERPILKLPLSQLDRLLERLAFNGVVMNWIYTALNYNKLPQTIPLHYNLKGDIDSYGTKEFIWLMPLLLTAIVFGLTILNRYPHIFNYPVRITQENAERQYALATRSIRFMKVAVVALFIFLDMNTVSDALHGASGFEWWYIWLFLAIILVPLIFYIVQAYKKK